MPKLKNLPPTTKQRHRKALTQGFVSPLIAYFGAFSQHVSKCIKQYINAYYCCQHREVVDGKLRSARCKTRMCRNCNAIRTAQLINGYMPQLAPIMERGALYMVTLTLPTLYHLQAHRRLKHIYNCWRLLMIKRCKLQLPSFKGLRALEGTIRPFGFLHIHLHVLIEGEENARWLVAEWLKMNPAANRAAQDIRKANQGSLTEMFKYCTKLHMKDASGKVVFIPNDYEVAAGYNALFEAFKGRRLIQPFGGLKRVSEEIADEELIADELLQGKHGKEWIWVKEAVDWVSEHGELLNDTEFVPPNASFMGYYSGFKDPPPYYEVPYGRLG